MVCIPEPISTEDHAQSIIKNFCDSSKRPIAIADIQRLQAVIKGAEDDPFAEPSEVIEVLNILERQGIINEAMPQTVREIGASI